MGENDISKSLNKSWENFTVWLAETNVANPAKVRAEMEKNITMLPANGNNETLLKQHKKEIQSGKLFLIFIPIDNGRLALVPNNEKSINYVKLLVARYNIYKGIEEMNFERKNYNFIYNKDGFEQLKSGVFKVTTNSYEAIKAEISNGYSISKYLLKDIKTTVSILREIVKNEDAEALKAILTVRDKHNKIKKYINGMK